ncbi:hypothetical protein OG900_19660 [Streptomyces sp. NBC_00433]
MSSTRNSGKRISRLLGIATTVALGGALLAPAAHADSPGAPLTVAVSDVTHHAMNRGSGTNSFVLTVTNTTGTTQPFAGNALVWPNGSGPSPIEVGQIHTEVTPVSAPATDLAVEGQMPGLIAAFFPHGGNRLTSSFQIPAGADYSWKITVGAAADFPGNDDGLDVEISSAQVHFDIGPALPDGHVTEKFDHAATVTPRKPGETTLTLSNGAGGKFTSPLRTRIYLDSAVPGLKLQYRSGGKWVPATTVEDGSLWMLPEIPAGFAYRQTHSFPLRFTLEGQPAGPRDVSVYAQLILGDALSGTNAQTTLHLTSAAKPTSTPTSAPSSAPASAPAPAPSAAVKTSGSQGATSGSSTPDTQLAHTGSSHTGLLAGLAGLLAATGAFLVFTVNRRRRSA